MARAAQIEDPKPSYGMMMCKVCAAGTLLITLARGLHLKPPPFPSPVKSRRHLLTSCLIGLVTTTTTCVPSAFAAAPTAVDRSVLLDAISRNAPDDEVISIITKLEDPSLAARNPERLEGEWELIWSYKAEAFSPLLRLPPPFRPTSYQYLGAAAAPEVGDGRIAQGLTGGVLLQQNQLWLSSGAMPSSDDPSILEIKPPFRLELGGRFGTGKQKRVIVGSGSDADFRQVNGRTQEAQAAGPNQYQQLYVEGSGPGSLRISSVIAGDPVIVGEIFVHRKL